MTITEEVKEAIRRHIQYEVDRAGVGEWAPNLDDWTVYDKTWHDLKDEMCRLAGVTGAITANMVTEQLHKMVIRRVSRYKRDPVI